MIFFDQLMKYTITILLILAGIIFMSIDSYAQQQAILRETTSTSGGGFHTVLHGKSVIIQQSIGQASNIGTFSNNKTIVRQGFIQPSIYTASMISHSELEVSIFPNPFDQRVYIEFIEQQNAPVDVKIFDVSGRTVFAQTYYNTNSERIELHPLGLVSGSYIITLKAENKSFSTILIKS